MEWILGVLGALFIFGGLWFYIWSAAIFFLLVGFTENECDGWAGILFVGFVAGISYFNAIEFNLGLKDIALYFFGYIALGCGWSFFKWVSFLFKTRESLTRLKTDFLNTYVNTSRDDVQVTKITDERFDEFAKYLRDHGYASDGSSCYGPEVETRDDLTPDITNYKGKVSRWIAYWPFSAFWTILDDPIRRIAEWLYSVLQGFYRKIANAVFAKVEV